MFAFPMPLGDSVLKRFIPRWYQVARNQVQHFSFTARCVNCCRVVVVQTKNNDSATFNAESKYTMETLVQRISDNHSDHGPYRFHQRRYTASYMCSMWWK